MALGACLAREGRAGPGAGSDGRTQGGAVPGHDQTSLRVHRRAWFGIILAVTALVVARPARGQDEPAAAAAPVRAREPIDLAARRSGTGSRGRTVGPALRRGGRPARRRGRPRKEIVVRVKPITAPERRPRTGSTSMPRTSFRSPGSRRGRDPRSTFETDEAPQLTAYDSRSLYPLTGPPGDSWPLARSGFLKSARPSTLRSRLAQKPASALPTSAPTATAAATANNPAPAPSTSPDAAPPGVVALPEPQRPGRIGRTRSRSRRSPPRLRNGRARKSLAPSTSRRTPETTAEPARPPEGGMPPAVEVEAAPADVPVEVRAG